MDVRFLPLILGTVALSAAAQFLLKLGMSTAAIHDALVHGIGADLARAVVSNGFVWGGLIAYGLSAAAWLFVLARNDLSVAYPFVSLGFVLTAMLGAFVFNEPVGVLRIAGILLVGTGVYLIAKS